jgi:hypothetical protein
MWLSAGNMVSNRSFVGWQGTAAITSVTFSFLGHPLTSTNSIRLYGVA